jgi:hypothetical protein
VAQVVGGCLTSKHKALNSNSNSFLKSIFHFVVVIEFLLSNLQGRREVLSQAYIKIFLDPKQMS